MNEFYENEVNIKSIKSPFTVKLSKHFETRDAVGSDAFRV